jgi:hypothetical protein
MPPKGCTKGKDPKGKGSAVYFASQKLVRPPYNLLEGDIFEVHGSWWGSYYSDSATGRFGAKSFWFMLSACKCVFNFFLF